MVWSRKVYPVGMEAITSRKNTKLQRENEKYI